MSEGVTSDSLAGKRRIASYALERDYAPFARSLLWKLGYAVLPAEEVSDPELRIVREDRLGEIAKLPPLPMILITDRRQPESGDARVTGTVRRPAGVPPLYRLQHGGKSVYARNDAHKDELLETVFKGKKPEISRFKGLGEMMPQQLKETTMDPAKRILLKVMVDHEAKEETSDTVERLMGNKPEARFTFIQERAAFAGELIDL